MAVFPADPTNRPTEGNLRVNKPTVAILGDGQMGLVSAAVLLDNGEAGAIRLWGHDPQEIACLARNRVSDRLSDVQLSDAIEVTSDLAGVLCGAELVISAIPVQFMRSVWERVGSDRAIGLPPGAGVVSVSKGIECETLLRPTEIIGQAIGQGHPLGVLSGPTIASELARRCPASMVASANEASLAAQVQQLFSTGYLRVYTGEDTIGVELAGALKNVIAIAAGILDGLEMGYNAKSALLARGLAEIVRIGDAMGARAETFFGLTGVGDLATTCFCPEGRNRSCGEALGRGERLEAYLARTQSVVEGVATAKAAMALASGHGVELPIAQSVYAVLYEGLGPREAIRLLMSRELKNERVG